MKKLLAAAIALMAALTMTAAVQAQTPPFHIDEWQTDPDTLTRGEAFTLTLTMTNVGTRSTDDVMVAVEGNETFVGLGQSVLIDEVGRDESFTVELRVGVSTSATTGYYDLPIRISHYPISTQRLEEVQTIGVRVEGLSPASQSPAADAPRLLVDATSATPDPAIAGQATDLTLTVANVGGTPAEQVIIRLSDLGPLAPTRGSNVARIAAVPTGATSDVTYNLLAAGDASAGLYPITVELSYRDALGVQQTDVFTIGVRIATPANLVFNSFEPLPTTVLVGQEVEFPLEVINIGSSTVNVSTATVEAEGMTITQGASQYIGPLEGGTAGTIVAAAAPEEAGTGTVTVTINYLDDFSQQQTETFTFELDIEESAEGEGDESAAPAEDLTLGQRVLRAVAGFFGIGTREVEMVEGFGTIEEGN